MSIRMYVHYDLGAPPTGCAADRRNLIEENPVSTDSPSASAAITFCSDELEVFLFAFPLLAAGVESGCKEPEIFAESLP